MVDPLRLSIEIGHVATEPDTSAHCSPDKLTPEQELILKAVKCSVRTDWDREVRIPNVNTATDDWVAAVLQAEINSQLVDSSNEVEILKKHVVWPCIHPQAGGIKPQAEGPLPTSPDPGTQCRLVGNRWVNVRTYYLYKKGGVTKWLFAANSNHIAIATLTWECRKLNPCTPGGSAMPSGTHG